MRDPLTSHHNTITKVVNSHGVCSEPSSKIKFYYNIGLLTHTHVGICGLWRLPIGISGSVTEPTLLSPSSTRNARPRID